jgi:hypothetical protein
MDRWRAAIHRPEAPRVRVPFDYAEKTGGEKVMVKLLYHSERLGCGATFELNDKNKCMVSVARTGVLVKAYPGRFSFFGSILYNEKNVYLAGKTAAALSILFPERRTTVIFKNPVLAAFANAICQCSTASEVATTLNEAVMNAEK